jgi:Zn-dependent peptidase ImmA (M78 family)/DNA-binding XRE family transcriptional regulator
MDFNKDLLTVARESRGLSQAALARRANVAQGTLSKIENGMMDFSAEIASKIAVALNYPMSFFEQADKVIGLPYSVHPMHRKKANAKKNDLTILHAKVNIVLMHIKRLLKSIEFTHDFDLPDYKTDELSPQTIAAMVRAMWLLPNGPVENLTSCIEKTGVLIVHLDFPSDSISGLSINNPEVLPCIFLNKNLPSDKMRLTLAHEFGHLIMHKFPNKNMEDEAFSFASELLTPSHLIKGSLMGKLDLWRVGQLKRIWKVSMAALVYRAHKLKAIDDQLYQNLFKEISRRGYRLEEPIEFDFPCESPTVFPEMIDLHLKDLGYSIAELANVLRLNEYEFRKYYHLFENPGVTLRVVK